MSIQISNAFQKFQMLIISFKMKVLILQISQERIFITVGGHFSINHAFAFEVNQALKEKFNFNDSFYRW
jgi:hypothetical protein